ncbi:glycerophosphodiester phosphodiesterase family protein [Polymorphum gilvum]|uniref:Glycerophosphoryl diester phosphodiesterase family n=1 Tax=Polymorphum gilvum (strain LMG 25793 / CGMCC 1.9160 / SL003B-26A1) TaxID=991905 RepID=F2IVX9_POLGS|nr:glycerophosphodiester phosphodiesterase family protein [Polymorphum gilvum]ADZ70261.1 Glycerophosphoryl diester phosphodiesterase family [Polymorphum gilvum SL003B-26A1]
MTDLSWLVARPIAHRGYHDAAAGVIENTPSAVAAAVERGFSIEVDLQETADGRALVFHDHTLDRLAEAQGPVVARSAAELVRVPMRTGSDRLWLLEDLFDLVDGRVTLVVEIKTLMTRAGQQDFVRRIADLGRAYKGPVAFKSFDPDMVGQLRAHAPDLVRGQVADATPNEHEYRRMTRMDRFIQRHLLHAVRTRPHFVSYCFRDLPAPGPAVLRALFGRPVMAWTVRSPADRAQALRHADQIVFEGFDPDAS